jgi:RHS repeat-associated protein
LTIPVAAFDGNGDSLIYRLVSVKKDGNIVAKPSSLSIDANTGKIAWKPSYESAGKYLLEVSATDGSNASDTQTVAVEIFNVDRPPTLKVSNRTSTIGSEIKFTLEGKDPDLNTSLIYSANNLPLGATLNALTGEFIWLPMPGQLGTYPIDFQVSDGEMTATSQSIIRIANNLTPPQLTVDLTPSFPVLPSRKVVINALAESFADIDKIEVKVDGSLANDFRYNDSHNGGSFTFSSGVTGRHIINVTATDIEGRSTTLERVIKVKDPTDNTAPIVSFTAADKIDRDLAIVGKVSDINLDEWQLEISEINRDNYRTIAAGNTSIETPATLGTVRVGELTNGFYTLKLTGKDIGGRISVATKTIEVNTGIQAKSSKTDLNVNLAGINIDLNRYYRIGATGSFGKDWQDNLNGDIQLNLVDKNEGLINGTRLYITAPTGERIGFTFIPASHIVGGLTYYTPQWQADSNTGYKLASVETKLIRAGEKFYDMLTGVPYHPDRGIWQGANYTLTAPSGAKYEYNAIGEIISQISASGKKATYSDSGILAATGEAISWVKDKQGNLVSIDAPDGTQLSYTYNSNGQLINISNRGSGKEETFSYDDSGKLHAIIGNIGESGTIYGTGETIASNLGTLANFVGKTTTSIGNKLYAFQIAESELNSTATANILISAETTEPASVKLNDIPSILQRDNYRIFSLARPGINLLSLDSSFTVNIVGDINGDLRVDGTDAALVRNALDLHTYDIKLDLNRDNKIDAADLQLVAANYGVAIADSALPAKPMKAGSVRKSNGQIILTEGENWLTQATSTVTIPKGFSQGNIISFDVITNFDTTDKTSANEDIFSVYLRDRRTGKTILNKGTEGTPLFAIAGNNTTVAEGIATYDGKQVQIDVGSINVDTDAELVFQLLNQDNDNRGKITISNLTAPTRNEKNAGILTSQSIPPVAAGKPVDLSSYNVENNAKLIVDNISFDSYTGKYLADIKIQNIGTELLTHNLAIKFANLPAGITLLNPSGVDGANHPYINAYPAITFGGLAAGEISKPLQISFDNPDLLRLNLQPIFLTGAAVVAPTFLDIQPLSIIAGKHLAIDLVASNNDDVPVVTSVTAVNGGVLSYRINNNRLTIDPSALQVGSYTIDLVARQGNLFSKKQLQINILPDAITTTRISGVLRGTNQQPLSQTIVSVGNETVSTDNEGKFTLTLSDNNADTVLRVNQTILADGSGNTGFSASLNSLLGRNIYRGVDNPLLQTLFVGTIVESTQIETTTTTRLTIPTLPNVSLKIDAGNIIDTTGTPVNTRVSITEIPLTSLPASLPETFYPDTVVAVTLANGAKFKAAAQLVMPNRAGYVAGTTLELWHLDDATGTTTKVGTGVVAADGKTISPNTGGVIAAGIYTYLPIPAKVVSQEENPFSAPTSRLYTPAGVPINSEANLVDGTIRDSQTLVGYQSQGVRRNFTLHYNSKWANPVQFFNGQIPNFQASPNYNRLVERWVIRHGDDSHIVDGSEADIAKGIHKGDHFYRLPNVRSNGKTLTTPLTRVDWFKEKTSGVYQVAHTLGFVKYEEEQKFVGGAGTTTGEEIVNINRSDNKYGNASFGAGWSLGGVQELLLTRKDGINAPLYRDKIKFPFLPPNNKIDDSFPVTIVDGDGTMLMYRPSAQINGALTFTNATIGDLSKFEKNLMTGEYTRTLPSGEVYIFNAWGQLRSIADTTDSSVIANVTNFEYTTDGHLKNITDPVGLKTEFTYDANNRVTEMKTPGDVVTKFEYDVDGNLTKIENPDGGERKWTYGNSSNNQHQITTFTQDRELIGNNFTGTDYYDNDGRSIGAKRLDGQEIRYQTVFGDLSVYNPADTGSINNERTLHIYSEENLLAKIKNANQQSSELKLSKSGQILESKDALKRIATTEYNDVFGLPELQRDVYGNATTFKYDDFGNPTDIIYGTTSIDVKKNAIFSTTQPLNLGGGNAIQIEAYQTDDGGVEAILGSAEGYLQFIKYNPTTKEVKTAFRSLSTHELVYSVNNEPVSLQQLAIRSEGDTTYLYVGYDRHGNARADNIMFFLKDYRNSESNIGVRGSIARFELSPSGDRRPLEFDMLRTSLSDKDRFSIADIAIGQMVDGKTPIVAFNGISNQPRLGFVAEIGKHKLESQVGLDLSQQPFNNDNNGSGSTAIIPSIDYYDLGEEVTILNSGIVAATVPNRHQIVLKKWVRQQGFSGESNQASWIDEGSIDTRYEVSALETISLKDRQGLVFVAGKELFIVREVKDKVLPISLGRIGSSQAMAVGDVTGDGIDDIVVADYSQNLRVYVLDEKGNVTASQTTKINTKPRDLKIFDWNRDGFNDVLIADGGSGLDIKLNQLAQTIKSHPESVNPLRTTFAYEYAPNSSRIVSSTQTDILRDNLTRKTVSIFDARGRVTEAKVIGSDGLTAITKNVYSSRGSIEGTMDAEKRMTAFEYDNFGRLTHSIGGVKADDSSNAVEQFYEYDMAGNLIKSFDENGRTIEFKYDSMNRLTEKIQIDDRGNRIVDKTEYYLDGLIKSITDGENHTKSFKYDGLGRIQEEIAADGGVTKYTYDGVGNRQTVEDAVGNITRYSYDATQRLSSVEDVTAQHKVTYAYDSSRPIITTTESAYGEVDRVNVSEYDRFQRLVKTTNPIGTVLVNSYNADGTLSESKITDSSGKASQVNKYEYDTFGRQIKVIDALGNATEMAYDLVGNVVSTKDAKGTINKYTYDALNRRTKAIAAVGTVVENTTQYQYDDRGNLTATVDPLGHRTKSTYDSLNRLTAMTVAEGTANAATTKYEYDKVGNITAIVDANNNRTTYEYDSLNRRIKSFDVSNRLVEETAFDKIGRISKTKNAYGEETTYTYNDLWRQVEIENDLGTTRQVSDAFGNVIKTVDPLGNVTEVKYDRGNRRTQVIDAAGGVSEFEYDDFNNLISSRDPLNRLTKYTYDNLNRLRQTDKPLGVVEKIDYDVLGNKRLVTDGENRQTEYVYDESNRLIETIDPLRRRTRRGYDLVGNVKEVIDAKGTVTKYYYDELNRQTEVIQADRTVDETVTTYIYDKVGNLLSEKNGRGFVTEYVYDEFDRRKETIDPLGNSTRIKYDIAGNVVEVIDANNRSTFNVYDTFGRQIETYDATNRRTSKIKYDALDRVIESTDTFGKLTTIEYQDKLRTKITTDPLGVVSTEVSDAAGNLTDTYITVKDDANVNRHTQYKYDELNRKTKIVDAEGGITKYDFYKDGQIKSVTDAVENVTSYVYDRLGRLQKETNYFGDRTYDYDEVDNLISVVDRNGRKIGYDYDLLQRITSEKWVGTSQEFTYTYDKNGNVLTANDGSIEYKYSYDNDDRLAKVVRLEGTKPTVSFAYDRDRVGNLIKVEEYIANTLQATTIYKYDDPRYLNTEILQTGTGLADKRVKFGYDATGLNTSIHRYSGENLIVSTTNNYDEYGRLKGITQENNTGTIDASYYALDALNRLTKETNNGVIRQFGYDNIDQVTSVNGSNSESYSYDDNGNRIGNAIGDDNRLISDNKYRYDYDKEGNRTKRTHLVTGEIDKYTWDYRNRLASVVTEDSQGNILQSVAYRYDADNQRVQKVINNLIVENYYLNGDEIAFVTDRQNQETFHYLYGLEVDSVLAQDSPTQVLWSLADRMGSVDTLVNDNGTVVDTRSYDSFGNLLTESNSATNFRYGYTGREDDTETDLSFYRARYYDASVGQFISNDPLGFSAGDTNLYRYVGNRTTLYTDPSGNLPVLLGVALGVLAVGALASTANQLENNNYDVSKLDVGKIVTDGITAAAMATAVTALTMAAGAAAIAVGVPASFVVGTGIVLGAFGVGKQLGSAWVNLQNGKPLSALVDVASAIYGIRQLATSGYPKYQELRQQEFNALANNARPIFQSDLPVLNSSGAIVPAQSSALTTVPPGTPSFSSALVLARPSALATAPFVLPPSSRAIVPAQSSALATVPSFTPPSISSLVLAQPSSLATVPAQQGSGQCFIAGTEIITINGIKNIEDIQVGDLVLADDPTTPGEIEYKPVLNTFIKNTTSLIDIYIDSEHIAATDEHPFWVPDVGWVAAKDLTAGMYLQTRTEAWLDIDQVERHIEATKVYNLALRAKVC